VDSCDTDAGSCTGAGKACCGTLCIDTTRDPLNCGGCAKPCSTVNGAASCSLSTCSIKCNAGYGDCIAGASGPPAGCETKLINNSKACGACINDCTLAVKNATGITCSGTTGHCG